MLAEVMDMDHWPPWVSAQLENQSPNCPTVECYLGPTLSNPWDCSPPGSSVHGIFQERILEWIVIPFFRGSSQCRD